MRNEQKRQDWTFDVVIDLACRMEAKARTGFSVSPDTAPLVIAALKHYAREHFAEPPTAYTVDIWDSPVGDRVVRQYAVLSDLFAARDVFARAAAQHPAVLVTVRQGIRVVERSKDDR